MTNCRVCSENAVPLSEFFPSIEPKIIGAPLALIEHEVREALIKLAKETLILKKTITIDAQMCVNDYRVELDEGYAIYKIDKVKVGCRELSPKVDAACCMASCGYVFQRPCDLFIYPAPDEDAVDAISMDITVVPSKSSCVVEKWVHDLYESVVADLALSKLFMYTGGKWYSPQMSGYHAASAKIELIRIKTDVTSNFNNSIKIMRAGRSWI